MIAWPAAFALLCLQATSKPPVDLPAWSWSVPARIEWVEVLRLGEGRVLLVAFQDGAVHAIEAETGRPIWREPLQAAPGVRLVSNPQPSGRSQDPAAPWAGYYCYDRFSVHALCFEKPASAGGPPSRWVAGDRRAAQDPLEADPEFLPRILAVAVFEEGVLVQRSSGALQLLSHSNGRLRAECSLGSIREARLFSSGRAAALLRANSEQIDLQRIALILDKASNSQAAGSEPRLELESGRVGPGWPIWSDLLGDIFVAAWPRWLDAVHADFRSERLAFLDGPRLRAAAITACFSDRGEPWVCYADRERVTCLDPATGRRTWEWRVTPPGSAEVSRLVSAQCCVIAVTESTLWVLQGDDGDLLAGPLPFGAANDLLAVEGGKQDARVAVGARCPSEDGVSVVRVWSLSPRRTADVRRPASLPLDRQAPQVGVRLGGPFPERMLLAGSHLIVVGGREVRAFRLFDGR